MIYYSKSPEETKALAQKFSKELEKGDVITLNGDLGVGKTAFTQGLAEGLGIKEYLNSPTFTIVNCYEGDLPLYHFDVYRIEDEDEMYEIGYEEYIFGDGVSVIEWAENIEDALPKDCKKVTIQKIDQEKRKIIFKHYSRQKYNCGNL